MRIGIFSGPAGKLFNIEEAISDAQAAQEAGFPSYWLPQMPMGVDALTSLSHIGASVPEIELGTAVIPTYTPPDGDGTAGSVSNFGHR